MKFKAFAILICLFLGLHLYISYLNPDNVKLYVGYGRYYETSVANYVTVSFVSGVIISIIFSFFSDIRRAISNWRERKKEKRRGELKELFERAKLYDMKGEREKAIEYVNRLIRTAPDMEEAYLLASDLYVSAKDYDKAREFLDLAEANLGKKESILFRKVRMHLATKDMVRLEQNLKDILKGNESSIKALTILRDLHVCNKEWDDALDLEKRLKKQVKTDEETSRFIGIQYEKAKELFEKQDESQYETIIKTLKEITGENKRFIPGYILAGEVYKKMNKPNEAGRVYGRGYSKTGHIIFLLKMEDLYISRGDPGVILKIYRRILDISPKNHLIMFLYARLCLRLEMIDEAIDMLNTLFAEGEDFRGLHRAMAEAYIHRGELEDALAEFRKAFPIEHVYIPFVCEKCQAVKEEWTDFCESCYSWNTVNVKQEGLFHEEAEDLRKLYEQEWEV